MKSQTNQDLIPSGSATPSTNPKESGKQSITIPRTGHKNPWIVVKIRYYEYILPAGYLEAVMAMFSDMEELDDGIIKPVDEERAPSIRFMSQIMYDRARVNSVLTKEVN